MGEQRATGTPTAERRREAPSGVASLIIGIIGIFVLPPILPAVALYLGYRARREAAEQPDRYVDELGRVGRILGWVGLVLGLLGIVVVLLAFLVLFPALGGPTVRDVVDVVEIGTALPGLPLT
jgi:hypothetical protein